MPKISAPRVDAFFAVGVNQSGWFCCKELNFVKFQLNLGLCEVKAGQKSNSIPVLDTLDDFLDFGRYVVVPKEDFVEEYEDLFVKEIVWFPGVGDGPIEKTSS